MTITLEITPEVAKIVEARAIARGVTLNDYLPPLIAQIAQQEEWAELPPEESLGRLIMLAAEPRLARIWDTPEEDAAWKYLEEDDEDASTATILGAETTMHRLWDTPEEDVAWKDL